MKIQRHEVEHVARLARLRLDEGEIERFTLQLGQILSYVEKLKELDTDSVEPTAHVLDLSNVFREDVGCPSLPRAEALSNAPEATDRFFRVPRIIEN